MILDKLVRDNLVHIQTSQPLGLNFDNDIRNRNNAFFPQIYEKKKFQTQPK